MNLHNTFLLILRKISKKWAMLKINYIFKIFKINGIPLDSSACILTTTKNKSKYLFYYIFIFLTKSLQCMYMTCDTIAPIQDSHFS